MNKNQTMESLNLSGNEITAQGMEYMKTLLLYQPTPGSPEIPNQLKILNLSSNNIGNDGIQTLCHALLLSKL